MEKMLLVITVLIILPMVVSLTAFAAAPKMTFRAFFLTISTVSAISAAGLTICALVFLTGTVEGDALPAVSGAIMYAFLSIFFFFQERSGKKTRGIPEQK